MADNNHQQLKQELISLAEPKYQQFQSALLPNVPSEKLIGVRLSLLRKIAKRIVKDNPKDFLLYARDDSFEEIMIQGMVIGYWKAELTEVLSFVERFVLKIDNWSVCDSFCCSLKLPKQYPAELWDFLGAYCKDKREFPCRFGIVMMLIYYINNEYIGEVFQRLGEISSSDYYVQMAIAWAISICYGSFPEKTVHFLENAPLADFVYNKALQKITELKNVSEQEKEQMRKKKRV